MAGVVTFGCHRPEAKIALEPVPLSEAARLINDNLAGIGGTLRAAGSVDGYFTTPQGQRRNYHLDGVLFHRSPTFVRFELKSFGETQMLLGSNAVYYWYVNARDESSFCGRHDEPDEVPADLPARPEQLADALGLSPIPVDPSGLSLRPKTRVVQRVEDDVQQLLLLTHDEQGRVVIEKEFWLDRFAPRLLRRVVFRDGDGVVQLQSVLEDYRPLAEEPTMLAHLVVAEWPQLEARMRFEIRKWTPVYQVGPRDIQFATHPVCLETRGSQSRGIRRAPLDGYRRAGP
jgi:hypothetical protein